MSIFEMVQYHNQEYPSDIPLRLEEVAAHFDVGVITSNRPMSLHTEYSYGKRTFSTPIIRSFPDLVSAQKDGVPQLWKDEKWAFQFADFLIRLVGNKPMPAVIEIHPPFDDYTSMEKFIDTYSIFEKRLQAAYPSVKILIENRCGSVYRGGKFLISKLQDVEALCNQIVRQNLKLRIAYDIPQIYTAHHASTADQYVKLLEDTKRIREFIGGVHLWGKRKSATGRKVSHCGDLTSYFDDDLPVKKQFLNAFADCFDDRVIRKMVLEVNSSNTDMNSILSDLRSVGTKFV